MGHSQSAKGSRQNNLADFALRFRLGLVDPIEQNHRNSKLFRGICEGVSAKDGLKLRCQNVKLFWREP